MNSRAQIDAMVDLINVSGAGPLEVNRAYGSYRVTSPGGAIDISPRLPAGEMLRWLRAYRDGFLVGRRNLAVSIIDHLWPTEDPERQWNSDDLEIIAEIVQREVPGEVGRRLSRVLANEPPGVPMEMYGR